MIFSAPECKHLALGAEPAPLVIFDGVCHLCSKIVQWILHRESIQDIYFLPLQSRKGQAFQKRAEQHHGHPVETIILFFDSKIYTKSDAVLAIGQWIKGYRKSAKAAMLLPSIVRDGCYRIVMRNRYRLFGKSDTCIMPEAKFRERFLDGL